MKDFFRKMMAGTYCPRVNVYRTRLFIVCQEISPAGCEEGAKLYSKDSFYLRTKDRDRIYSEVYKNRGNDGKRVKSELSSRTYTY